MATKQVPAATAVRRPIGNRRLSGRGSDEPRKSTTPTAPAYENRHHLAERARKRERDRYRSYREDHPSRAAGQRPRHRDHCGSDNSGRGELEAVHPACPFKVDASGPQGERRQDHRTRAV